MKHAITLFFLAALLILGVQEVDAQSLDSYSWSATPPNVASVSWSNAQIASFIDTITDSDISATVGDFKFGDFNADGNLELVASVDYTGRGLFNYIDIVQRRGSGFSVQEIPAWNVDSLKEVLADLNNDGKQELLVRTPLTPYLGTTVAVAGWTAIYSWQGPLLIDNTAAFTNYYESSMLPDLKSKFDQLTQSSPGSLPAAIAEIEYDKALRVTVQNPQAGLNEALAWAGSADPNLRILASAVLADIATPTAMAALTKLTSDPNTEVATYAKSESAQSTDLHYLPVQIDIKPGDPNKNINLKSQGSIPVAILSSSTFSAPNMVDVKSLTFGSSGNEPSLVSCAPEDVNNNGVFGLMCHFDTQAASFQATDVEGILKGKLKDGSAIKGVDVINPSQ